MTTYNNELESAETFICNKLTVGQAAIAAIVGTRIYFEASAEPINFKLGPCIVVSLASPGVDLMVAAGERLLTNPLYLVRGVDVYSGFSRINPLAGLIDTALHYQTAGSVIGCLRERPHSRVYVTDSVTYRERGGFYRLQIHGG
ncbi:MAG: hypothetical protein IMZ62_13510 [Chloroflexi bacterium]|nr:hypothetical protein [Chloroflexota bacterium]